IHKGRELMDEHDWLAEQFEAEDAVQEAWLHLSRARRRMRGSAMVKDADLAYQREVVDAFLTAARACSAVKLGLSRPTAFSRSGRAIGRPRPSKPDISKRSKVTPRARRSARVASRFSTSNAIWVDAPDGAPAELKRWNSVGPHT